MPTDRAGITAEELISKTTSASATGIPQRPLGQTGAWVSIAGLGGYHLGAIRDQDQAIRIMHAAIDEGLTFFDNAWEYHDGHSETLMGKALVGKRDKVFLMTKDCERDYTGSLRNLEESLSRLQTDHVDLWQFHECVYDNDPDWIFERGGIRAALEAQQQGKVRFIGFTGHKDPSIHMKLLKKPQLWDAAMMPVNVMDSMYRSFENAVIPACLKLGTGVIGMKGLGGGLPTGRFQDHTDLSAAECYRYCLSLPVSVQVMGTLSEEQLQANVKLAREFQPMTPTEMTSLRARIQAVATDGRHETFKSSQFHDGLYHRKQHGFELPAS